MVRVHRNHAGADRSNALSRTRAEHKKTKKDFKIILEAVTQEKKKIHAISSYDNKPPPGFGFIPAGHPEFTTWCKEQCRQRNLDVYNVSAKPKTRAHFDPEKISHHVHRMGHHFPLSVIELACNKFGYRFEDNILQRDAERWLRQHMQGYDERMNLSGSAAERETPEYIRGAIREMFPKVPEDDLITIATHAFEKGTDRVGNAQNLTLARRVQLAVVAHIRHNYTEYDKILKEKRGTWSEARYRVEQDTLAKLKEWRDEDPNADDNEMEETFREVIILDDDDDGGTPSDDTGSGADRGTSMEIVSSRATARELQPDYTADVGRVMPRIHYAPGGSIRIRPSRPAPSSSAHMSSQLHQAPHPPLHASRLGYPGERPRPTDYPYRSYVQPGVLHNSGNVLNASSRSTRAQYQTLTRAAQPMQMRGPDGQLYNVSRDNSLVEPAPNPIVTNHPQLEPVEVPRQPPRFVEYGHPQRGPAREENVQPQQRAHTIDRPAPPSRRTSDQDVVLPSIERETGNLPSPRRAANLPSTSLVEVQSPLRTEFSTSQYHPEPHYSEPVPKRLRTVYAPEEMRPRLEHSQPSTFRQAHNSRPVESYNRPRPGPYPEVVDLTSSPIRLPNGGARDVRAYSRAPVAAEPRYSYQPHPGQPHPRAVLDEYYDVRMIEPGRVPVERRPAPPPRDFIPLRDEPARPPVADRRVIRDRGYNMH